MKKSRFYLSVLLCAALAVTDGVLTYINTPDLTLEGNPLVTRLGLGWAALIAVNAVSLMCICALSYYSACKYSTIYTDQTKFTAYCSQIVYDRPDVFWKKNLPKNPRPLLASFGYALPCTAAVGRLIVVCEWLLITFGVDISDYAAFVGRYFFGRLDIAASAVLIVPLIFWWFYREFKKQLRAAR